MADFANAFAAALKKEVTKAETIGTKIAHKAVYYLASNVIHDSPIRQPQRWRKKFPDAPPGHYKNNWQIGINVRPETDIPAADPTGEDAKNRAFKELFSNMALGKKTIYLINNAKPIKIKKNGKDVRLLDIEDEGTVLSQMDSYAMAIEEGVGMDRDTWAYQLDDKGITPPGAVLGRATLNWWHHIQEAQFGND